MSKRIKWTVHTVNSKGDVYGNRYWFATYTRMSDGKSATFTANARSNAESLCHDLGGGWEHVQTTTEELPIREWNRRAKDLPYLNDCDHVSGCKIVKKAVA